MKERMKNHWNTDGLTSATVPYTRFQPEGLVAVREYRFAVVSGVRCLLLRWAKEADFTVDGFSFALEELDASGACIRRTEIVYGASDVPDVAQGETFVPSQGIPVSDPCADVRVCLTALTSGSYRYRVQGERVLVEYDTPEPWVYDGAGGRSDGLSDNVTLRVLSGRHRRARLLWPAGLLFVVAVLIALFYPLISEIFASL